MAVLALLLAAAFSATDAGAALNAYLTLEGQDQGPIPGEVTTHGREETILVTEIHHLMHQPVDPNTGQIIGALKHEPFIFTKEVDRATVPLYIAVMNNESLNATFRYYEIDQTGHEVHYFTIQLINARVIAIEPIKPETQDPATASFRDMERVRMIYQQIEISNETYSQQVNVDTQHP